MRAQDVISATPITGSAFSLWRDRIVAARLRLLEHHAALLTYNTETDVFHRLVAVFRNAGEPERSIVAESPEFGSWIASMRDHLERETALNHIEARQTLLDQFGQFLLLPALSQPEMGRLELTLEIVNNCLPIAGSKIFVKLDGTGRTATALVGSERITFTRDGAENFYIAREKLLTLCKSSVAPVATAHSSAGCYGYAPLGDHGIHMALSNSPMLGASLQRITNAIGERSNPNAVVIPDDAREFAQDVTVALELIAQIWPDMAQALALHTRYVVPIKSERVFSYSELSTPNVMFLRATPQNPLWYVELLIHESCHNWLASLIELIPIMEEDNGELFISPWRADPRPLHGIMFGTHAFAFVTLFLLRLIESGAEPQAVQRRALFEASRISQGYQLLREHGQFTRAGRIFLDSLGEVVRDIEDRCLTSARWAQPGNSVDAEVAWPTVS